MMKKLSLGILFLLAVSAVWAGLDPQYLPASTHYQGRNSFALNEGDGKYLIGHVEFAVYDTQEQSLTGYEGDARYVYAYQVFSYSTSTAPVTYFSLLGADFSGLNLDYDDTLGGEDSGGVSPTGSRLLDGDSKAVWDFANGTLIKSERSWFLFFYSNSDWVKGSFEVKASYNDDVAVPGDNGGIPEPATLALLLCGAVLSLKRKRS